MSEQTLANATPRKFYETATCVAAGETWAIKLDGRPVRTPNKNPLEVPFQELGDAIAVEWNDQVDTIKPLTMPLSGLANAAIDRVGPERDVFINQLKEYAESDLVCYYATEPDDLVARQHKLWDPVMDWAATELGIKLNTATGILHVAQPETSIDAVEKEVLKLNAFQLSGFTALVSSLSSVLLGLSVLKGQLDENQAFDAAYLDELFQVELWGEDYEAEDRRAILKADIASSVRFLAFVA